MQRLENIKVMHIPEQDLSAFQGDFGAVWVHSSFFSKNKLLKDTFVTLTHIRDGKQYQITRLLRSRSVTGLKQDFVGLWADDLHDLKIDTRKNPTVTIEEEPKLRGLWMWLKTHPSPIIRLQARINFFFAMLSVLLGFLSVILGISTLS